MRTHIHLGHLVAGITFMAFAAVVLAEAAGAIELTAAIVWPALLLAWGLSILMGALHD